MQPLLDTLWQCLADVVGCRCRRQQSFSDPAATIDDCKDEEGRRQEKSISERHVTIIMPTIKMAPNRRQTQRRKAARDRKNQNPIHIHIHVSGNWKSKLTSGNVKNLGFRLRIGIAALQINKIKNMAVEEELGPFHRSILTNGGHWSQPERSFRFVEIVDAKNGKATN